jgi:hypothetical protein
MMVAIAVIAALIASAIELTRRGRLRFEFYDDEVLEVEPLVNPIEVVGLEGRARLHLTGGRILDVEAVPGQDVGTWSSDPLEIWRPVWEGS